MGNKKQWSTDPCFNMDEPRRKHAKWNEDTEHDYTNITEIHLYEGLA